MKLISNETCEKKKKLNATRLTSTYLRVRWLSLYYEQGKKVKPRSLFQG